MFGAGEFGSLIFAELDGMNVAPVGGRRMIGGSGFPADWSTRLRRRPGDDLEAAEIEDLVAAGMLD